MAFLLVFLLAFSMTEGGPLKRGAKGSAPAALPAAEKTDWHDVQKLSLKGLGWEELHQSYTRLPAKAETMVTAPVWKLSKHSAGVYVQFKTNSKSIKVRWNVRANNSFNHMAPTAVKGVDLYAKNGQEWKWVGVGKPSGKANEEVIASSMPAADREFMLYLPLYDGVDTVSIGVEAGATMQDVNPEKEKPLVFYGTSIVQGACASRAGMAYPAIIGRTLHQEVVNLGFSGNGKMDVELAHLLAEIDANMYVLDCMPNMTPEEVEPKVVEFVKVLREKKPGVPIVVVENINYAHSWIDTRVAGLVKSKNQHLKNAYKTLTASGIKNLHYVSNQNLALASGEGTVDGIHLTDLGFVQIACELTKEIKKVEKKTKR
ncbi:SGNH/GDSL hydrolase family protein [Rufibacter quisquiliarum]|uniref:Hydrolase n=1 Tax=Rufibacter quisquiliarum TaxID=1549639 RepID=A0A839GM37_9BACT|nr:SGNH/GDSL hydrolase family protein [Rufibacter quisquiliarum]MBA9078913.1 hypothetical protein [Rufibacter quisquiliarum]